MFLFLLSVKYYVKFHGAKNGFCHPYNPCNYKSIEKIIDQDSEIIIRDKQLSSKPQLDEFRILVEKASKKGSKLYGCGTIINGITAPLLKVLITISKSNGFVLNGFTFTNFIIPIFNIENSKDLLFSNISITSCKASTIDSFFNVKNSTVVFNDLNVQQTSINYTSLFKFFRSSVAFNKTYMIQNFAFHTHEQPFILCINSRFSILNSNFIRCSTQFSPFISSQDGSRIRLFNSTYDDSRHYGLISLENGKSQAIIDNCTFNKFYDAIIYSNDELSETEISESLFIHNFGYDLSMIQVLKGKVSINRSLFVDNSGYLIFNISGVSSALNIWNSKFINNKPTSYIIKCFDNGKFEMKKTTFERNYFGNYSISSSSCIGDVDRAIFMDNTGSVLYGYGGNIKFTNNYIQYRYKDVGTQQIIYKESIIFDDQGTDIVIKNSTKNNLPFLEKYVEKNMYPIKTPVPPPITKGIVLIDDFLDKKEKEKEKKEQEEKQRKKDEEELEDYVDNDLPPHLRGSFEEYFSSSEIQPEITKKYVPLVGKYIGMGLIFVAVRMLIYFAIKI